MYHRRLLKEQKFYYTSAKGFEFLKKYAELQEFIEGSAQRLQFAVAF
jgi:predicted transcriptional regulator